MTVNRHGSATTELISDCEVKTERAFDAPRSLVFEALTKPEHVRKHFSPDPEPLHICEIDLQVGGTYHYAWFSGPLDTSKYQTTFGSTGTGLSTAVAETVEGYRSNAAKSPSRLNAAGRKE